MITVTVGTEKTKDEKMYPKLMQNQDGELFYMVRERYGLPLTGRGWDYSIKEPADFSNATYHIFTDYNFPLTLQNEY